MKAKRKSILSFFMVLTMLAALCLVPVQAWADELSAVEEARFGVVRVISEDDRYISTGTGFAVGSKGDDAQYFVTNCHVVDLDMDRVYITIDDYDNKIKARVIDFDAGQDLALLKISKPLSDRHPLSIAHSGDQQRGQKIYTLGFPGVSDNAGVQGIRLDSSEDDITVGSGTVSNPNYVTNRDPAQADYGYEDGMTYILSDVRLNHGNSGGPMIDEYGNVVGVNSNVIGLADDDINNMTLAISTEYVIDMLEENDVDYIEAGKRLDISTGLIVAIAAVAIVAIVAIVVLVSKRGSKNTAAQSQSAPAQPRVDTNVTPTVQRRMQVRCEKGPMQGNTVNSFGSVRVGRAGTQLAFPEGTPGVSREHCQFTLSPMGITVMDLNSSYGTYVNNRRLAPGEQVNLGEGGMVFLGSDKVMVSAHIVY